MRTIIHLVYFFFFFSFFLELNLIKNVKRLGIRYLIFTHYNIMSFVRLACFMLADQIQVSSSSLAVLLPEILPFLEKQLSDRDIRMLKTKLLAAI